MALFDRPRVFISHSSQDKGFAETLAWRLRAFGFEVWYDDWEIAVGESIVEKVFAGIDSSDALVVVLSHASVASPWVREELSAAVMRKLADQSIRILPVLIEDCRIPTPLRHLRHASFREDPGAALEQLLDSLAPGHSMWQALERAYEHFCRVGEEATRIGLHPEANRQFIEMYHLLGSAVHLRYEIELRRTGEASRSLDLFDRVELLAEMGIDVRSRTWSALVDYRSRVAHSLRPGEDHLQTLRTLVGALGERYLADDMHESLGSAVDRLIGVMRRLCLDWADVDNPT